MSSSLTIKQIMNLLAVCLFIIASSSSYAELPLNSADVPQAKDVVQQYFNALSAGDTQRIQNLISGQLLEQQQARLNSANYGSFLQMLYSGSQINILTSKVSGNEIQIDANISKPDQEQQPVRLYLVKEIASGDTSATIRIHKESAIN